MKDPFICWIFGILTGYLLGRLVGIVKATGNDSLGRPTGDQDSKGNQDIRP